jgi:quercetin dioxygenase-like cupin family protein
MTRKFLAFICLCGLVASAGLICKSSAQTPGPSPPKELHQSDLKGISGEEAMVFTAEFAPGQGTPWHVHPGGHEFVYVLDGALTFEDQNGAKMALKAGEVHHIDRDLGHTARDEGATPVNLIIFRVKEKAKPITAPFQH